MILSKINEIDERTTGPDDVVVWCSPDQRGHKNSLELFVISSCPLLNVGNAVLPMAQSRMGRCRLKPTIKCLLAGNGDTPFLEVILDDTLVQLVQDIRRDAREYIGVREICPKGRENRAEALGDELGGIFISRLRLERANCLRLIATWKFEGGATLVSRYVALGTPVFGATRNETLFRVIPDKRSKQRVYPSDQPVAAHHVDALAASSYKRLDKAPHAVMEKAVFGNGVVLEGVELRDR